MDYVILNKVELMGRIGVLEEEKQKDQRYVISVRIGIDLGNAGISDELADTIDYAVVYGMIEEKMKGSRFDLLESFAESLSSDLFYRFTRARKVWIQVLKPDAPIEGIFESAGVEISRNRDD